MTPCSRVPIRLCTLLVLLLATGVAPRAEPQQVPVFRGGVDLVTIGVTVTDRKGNLVTGLTADDFAVFEDGRSETVRYFSAGEGAPGQAPALHLGVLLDVSESMEDDIRFTRSASIKFLNTLLDAEDITLVDFDTEVRVARYGQDEFPRLVERIRQQKVSGSTALYDAIGVYLDGAAGQQGRKVMLLYTDGGDNRSSLSYGALLDLLKASDVTVYVIGELEHQSASTRAEQRMHLQQIADTTGGKAFFPLSVKDLDAVYEKVVSEIRAQYTVGYVATNARADGTWRKVEIRIARKDGRDYRIRARKGYFAPYRQP